MIIFCIIEHNSYLEKAEKEQFPGNKNLPSLKTQAALRSNLRPVSSRGILSVVAERARGAPGSCPEKSRIVRFEHISRPRRIKIPP
jgi:hypothetical protein